MDRYEVPIDDHLAPLVEAAERGDEVVIVDAGRVVARLAPGQRTPSADHAADDVCLRELRELFRGVPRNEADEAARFVREMRDEERF